MLLPSDIVLRRPNLRPLSLGSSSMDALPILFLSTVEREISLSVEFDLLIEIVLSRPPTIASVEGDIATASDPSDENEGHDSEPTVLDSTLLSSRNLVG